MSAITASAALGLATALCQLIAIIALVVLCLRVLAGSIAVSGFLRGLLVVVLIGQVLPALAGASFASAPSDGPSIVTAYQQMAESAGGTSVTASAPGLALVARSVAISAGIWAGLVASGVIYLPVLVWIIVTAVDLLQGTPLPSVALRLLFWWLLWSLCAGGVGTTVSRAVYQVATTIAQAALAAVDQPGPATPSGPSATPAAWSMPEIVAAATAAELPPALRTITQPLVQSMSRVLGGDSPAYLSLAAAGFIGEQALGGLEGIYLVSATGADPHASFSREYPSLDPLLSHASTPSVYLNSPDLAGWLSRAFLDGAGEVRDGTGQTVGLVPIGACPSAGAAIAAGYATLVSQERARLQQQLATLQEAPGGDLATAAWALLLQARLTRLAGYHGPTLVQLAAAPLAQLVAARYRAYYGAVLARSPTLMSSHQAANGDAWGILCLTAAASWWPPPASAGSLPADAFARLVCASTVRAGMEAPPINAGERPEPRQIGGLASRWFAYLVQLLIDSSLSVAYLVLAAVVWLFAPLAIQIGFSIIAVGCFILNLAYPVAAFLALFPRQAALLVDWAKGVVWVSLCIPFIVIGISLATPQSPADIIAPLAALSGSLFGGALGGMVAASALGPGAVTGEFISMLTGIVMILMSWWFAGLMMQPGLAGLTSAVRWMTQVASSVVAASAGGSGMVAQGLADSVRRAGTAVAAGRAADAAPAGAQGSRPAPAGAGLLRAVSSSLRAASSGVAGTPALGQAWSRLRALADPAVSGAAFTAAADGQLQRASALLADAGEEGRGAERAPPATMRVQPTRGVRVAADASSITTTTTIPSAVEPLARAGVAAGAALPLADRAIRDARRAGHAAAQRTLAQMPHTAQRAVAQRCLEQADGATAVDGMLPAAQAGLAAAVQSGDWPLIGRAAGKVLRASAQWGAERTLAVPVAGPAQSASSVLPVLPGLAPPAIAHHQGMAHAVIDAMTGEIAQRAQSLGLPTWPGIGITSAVDEQVRSNAGRRAELALQSCAEHSRAGAVGAAMASATLALAQARRSGDAALIGRSDEEVLAAAGAVMGLSSLAAHHEQALACALRGLGLLSSGGRATDAGDCSQASAAGGGVRDAAGGPPSGRQSADPSGGDHGR